MSSKASSQHTEKPQPMGDPYLMTLLNLDTSTPEFRLLELHPSTSTSLIMCTISSYSMDGFHPAYKALSYTWGPQEKFHSISLNGTKFHVGRNLWAFLEEMCSQGEYGVYWIDAICINQESVLEKNHQVQMMRRIYGTAEEVKVWLGEANHEEMSDTAMNLLVNPSTWSDLVENPLDGDSTKYDNLLSLLYLLRRGYWERIWIIQEIMVAKRISVHCGSKSLDWQSLVDFLFFASENGELERIPYYSSGSTTLVCNREKYWASGQKPTIVQLFECYSQWEASNVLDKVYALCGLASDGDIIIIDYGLTPTELFERLFQIIPHDWPRDHLIIFAATAHCVFFPYLENHYYDCVANRLSALSMT